MRPLLKGVNLLNCYRLKVITLVIILSSLVHLFSPKCTFFISFCLIHFFIIFQCIRTVSNNYATDLILCYLEISLSKLLFNLSLRKDLNTDSGLSIQVIYQNFIWLFHPSFQYSPCFPLPRPPACTVFQEPNSGSNALCCNTLLHCGSPEFQLIRNL